MATKTKKTARKPAPKTVRKVTRKRKAKASDAAPAAAPQQPQQLGLVHFEVAKDLFNKAVAEAYARMAQVLAAPEAPAAERPAAAKIGKGGALGRGFAELARRDQVLELIRKGGSVDIPTLAKALGLTDHEVYLEVVALRKSRKVKLVREGRSVVYQLTGRAG